MDKKFEFQPVDEGLGFHPFSDGLPYAPVSKTRPPAPTPVSRPAPVVPQPVSPPVSTPRPQAAVKPHYDFYYLFKRTLAALFDATLNISLCGLTFGTLLWKTGFETRFLFDQDVLFLGGAFLFVFHWAVTTAQEVSFSTTLGKRLFRLSLEGSPGQIFLRSLLFLVSLGFAGFGLLWALADSQKRTWHDLITQLQPRENLIE